MPSDSYPHDKFDDAFSDERFISSKDDMFVVSAWKNKIKIYGLSK